MVAAPRLDGSNPLSALAAALRITQAALEASQAATFGAEVCYLRPSQKGGTMQQDATLCFTEHSLGAKPVSFLPARNQFSLWGLIFKFQT